MEVDIPQPVNSFMYNESSRTSPTTVQFNAFTKVKTYQPASTMTSGGGDVQQQPKHKSRRRARLPKIDTSNGKGEGNLGSPTGGKPLSPSKLKKMAEKDRHSRTGRRGNPKKGINVLILYIP